MRKIDLTVDELVRALLSLSESEHVSLLDSCGVGHLGSHLLIAGVRPVETLEIANQNGDKTIDIFGELLSRGPAAVFTISYDLGLKLEKIESRHRTDEPDISAALFECLILHDYDTGETRLVGESSLFDAVEEKLKAAAKDRWEPTENLGEPPTIISNFTRADYISAIDRIKEYIRDGETYQTNLTQQLRAEIAAQISPQQIFWRLRRDHPAPFAAFITRPTSTVVSASPERFVKMAGNAITASPIKGTRPRGNDPAKDEMLRNELLSSGKDRAENTMIVDLLRNDIGRICEFGSVAVEKLCALEEHPTLFHLVSTISGRLRGDVEVPDVLRAVYPCGSITGAPKIRTMQIIDEIETVSRGLSMGAIGYSMPATMSGEDDIFDMNVAIRTIMVRENEAVFNVGGGIVIDSEPEREYEESLLKAKALIAALSGSWSSGNK